MWNSGFCADDTNLGIIWIEISFVDVCKSISVYDCVCVSDWVNVGVRVCECEHIWVCVSANMCAWVIVGVWVYELICSCVCTSMCEWMWVCWWVWVCTRYGGNGRFVGTCLPVRTRYTYPKALEQSCGCHKQVLGLSFGFWPSLLPATSKSKPLLPAVPRHHLSDRLEC